MRFVLQNSAKIVFVALSLALNSYFMTLFVYFKMPPYKNETVSVQRQIEDNQRRHAEELAVPEEQVREQHAEELAVRKEQVREQHAEELAVREEQLAQELAVIS